MAPTAMCRDGAKFPLPSPSLPLLPANTSLAAFAADYALRDTVAVGRTNPSFAHVLWSAAEAISTRIRIERPGEKGGEGIYVERTLLDAFLPFNATLSVALAFLTASANELTRSGKINDLVTYLAGEEEEPAPPPSLPWEWDRVGHDTVANMAKDCGSQTLTRLLERQTKLSIGGGDGYCQLLKHAHKAACKEYHTNRTLFGKLSSSTSAAQVIVRSPVFFGVRAVACWVADIFVDAVAYCRGQLDAAQVQRNAYLKLVKYSLGGVLSLAMGAFVPYLYPHPYIFIAVEQLGANLVADAIVEKFGKIEPS